MSDENTNHSEASENGSNSDSEITNGNPLNDDGLFQCPTCPYQTHSEANLKEHKVIHEGQLNPDDDKVYSCTECSFKSPVERYLNTHMTMKHPKNKLNKGEQKKTDVKKGGNMSEKVMEIKKPFKCDQCPYQGKQAESLLRHKKKHLLNKAEVFKCDKCSFSTIHKYSFTNHLTIHLDPSEKNVWKCDECPYECRLKQLLIRHKQQHLQEIFGNFALGHFLDSSSGDVTDLAMTETS